MARKRMFDNEVVDQDSFMDLPNDSKALYFLLGMKADDAGFVSPRAVMRSHQISDDALKLLILKKFVIPFPSGVIVITDWKRNNWLDNRRTSPTIYTEELKQLSCESGKYTLNKAVDKPLSNGLATAQQALSNGLATAKQALSNGLASAEQPLSKCLARIEENRVEENRVEENRVEESREEEKRVDQPLFDQSQNSYYDSKAKTQNQVNGDMLNQVRFGNEIRLIMEHLNRKTNAKNRDISIDTVMLLTKWLSEGYKVEDIQRMISFKCKEWMGKEKTEIWCRPSTLFGEKNFKRYMEDSAGYEDLEDECRRRYNYL